MRIGANKKREACDRGRRIERVPPCAAQPIVIARDTVSDAANERGSAPAAADGLLS